MALPRRRVHSLALELTARCNQHCRYCYNAEALDEDSAATAQAARAEPGGASAENAKIVARLRRLLEAWDLGQITLTGGEPLAEPAVWEVLALCQQVGLPAQMISNGGLVDDAVADRLASLSVRSLQLTLNGPSAALHGAHTGDERHFERAISGARALRRRGIAVVGSIVVTKRNAAHIAATLELWLSLGVLDVALSRFSPAGRAAKHATALLPTRTDMMHAFEQAQPFALRRGMRLTCTMPIPPCMFEVADYAPIRFGTCSIGTSLQEFALGPDGRLRNCTLHQRPIGEGRDVLGPDVDLVALLEAQDVSRYREQYPEFCQGCAHAQACGGGCGAAADWVLGRGSRRKPDPFLWQHMDDELWAELQRNEARRAP